jgi:hypothetical protein
MIILNSLPRILNRLGLGFLLALLFGSIELFYWSYVFLFLKSWYKIMKESDLQ